MKLVIGALCQLLCFWTRKKKRKLKATETSLVIGRYVFGGFVPHGSHTDIWHVPLYLLQTQTLCVWRECSRFLNPTVQTFCLNIRAIAQHNVVCVAKEFREELIGGSPQVGCKTKQAWSPRNQLIWGDGRGYTLNTSPGQRNTEGQTNIARTYRKFYAANQPLWACLKEVGASQEGLTQTQGIGNIDHIDKALFLPLDNMNNSSANRQWSVHVSLL